MEAGVICKRETHAVYRKYTVVLDALIWKYTKVFDKNGSLIKRKVVNSTRVIQLLKFKALERSEYGQIAEERKAAQGVKIDDFRAKQHEDLKSEVCRYSEAPRQTSRYSMMTAQVPLQRVHFDLIQMEPALNGDQWISHFYDENTRFHNVFSHRLKNGCVGAFNTYILQIQNIAKTTIKFFKSDREQTLGNAVKEEEALKGIIHEYSVVDTPDQNGAAERAGAILILKARKMMIEAKLPWDLWPWVIGEAANIPNRSPIAALGWKTPFEKLSGKKPDLSALRTIGCVAYTRQEQQKSDKMAPRAY
ncbi:uncharacterized protein KD926_010051 [Aspergillus affinis]|uniref:uncharacterized protein n=1 Tax=Aspergillus affinis TaxID=1070780 RepID=UPI0022FE613A|nr:uncharacterized protein KD926_010051 [Aspergillus affinis]KAI9038951.1 hypothetical protein KD926_010051 [Aspergillus affinis]